VEILVVNHYAERADASAGTRHSDLAREWVRQGHGVGIVSCSFSHFGAAGISEPHEHRSSRQAGVQWRALWAPPYSHNGVKRIANVAVFAGRVALLNVGDVDVVVGSSPDPLAAFGAMRLARRAGSPFVFEVRDLWPETLVDLGAMGAEGKLARCMYALERRLIEDADAVVGVMPGITDYIEQRQLRVNIVRWIPNAPSPSQGTADLNEDHLSAIREIRGEDGFVALYAGSHGPANGLAAVVRAAALCVSQGRSDIKVVLVGSGPEKARLKRLASGFSNVAFLDAVPKSQVGSLLAAADGLVFHLSDAPVFRFGISPNKLADYAASGRPILFAGPRLRGFPPADAAGAVATPDDPESIASGLMRLADLGSSALPGSSDAAMLQWGIPGLRDNAEAYLALFEQVRRSHRPERG
jgi:glycosyltransferase involved in cell wall biosynthesis